ncbi:MAG: ATP-binding protein, partial [Gammaproteobacteria bacterium]|nr:ATP-binding protein [Gammaproteobacteria bacterium]
YFDKDTQFAFIKMQLSAFKRMISNLNNNAADAFDNNPVQVALQLGSDNEWVKISIQDTGKGMPQEMIEKILKKTSFTEGKEAGHGIGLMQVWETLEINQGELHIESKPGKGTTMVVKFPRIKAPYWIIDEILLIKNDIVIILDDDTSIHGAWQTRFDSIIDKNNNIQLKHFQAGKEVLAFIYSLSPEEKERILLLSDYELLNQELNGLHIIEKSGIKRSILVTSHYADPLLRELSAKTDTKILPKQLASEILIKILSDGTKIPTKVDAVLVEDDEVLSSHFVLYVFKDKRVDQYVNPEGLLKNIHGYSKTTKIYLDNNYKNSLQKGIDVAKHLHQQGYERLYLLSGESFRKEELPEYLTVIRKEDIESLRNSINS